MKFPISPENLSESRRVRETSRESSREVQQESLATGARQLNHGRNQTAITEPATEGAQRPRRGWKFPERDRRSPRCVIKSRRVDPSVIESTVSAQHAIPSSITCQLHKQANEASEVSYDDVGEIGRLGEQQRDGRAD